MNHLSGKQIVLAVTGSIAAVETVRLIHALRRDGAVVQPVMSAAATGILHPDALTYAAGRETITRIGGLVEHVAWCGDNGIADLLIIAPCTANTIGKIAHGIDDTPPTTFATTALGRRMPILVVPAMHHAMFRHDAVMENLDRLRSWGIEIAGPRIEEGKAKIADIPEIVRTAERMLSGLPLGGTRVLITSGRCEEPVDNVRVLTTRSSGTMGKALAAEAYRLGADVTIIHRDNLPFGTNIRISTAASMKAAVERELSQSAYDLYIGAAAVSDFAPEPVFGKIPSGTPCSVTLHPLPKILDLVKGKVRHIIAFKIGETSVSDGEAMLNDGIDIVLANRPETMGSSEGIYLLLDRLGREELAGQKDQIATGIFSRYLSRHF